MTDEFRYEYKYAPRHLPFMKEQIWEAKKQLSIYSDLSVHEFTQLDSFIDNDIKSVLEVGCGLGRGSIFLNHMLRDDTIKYTLADRSGYTTNTGDFNPPEDEFYNDLVLTKDFCELNGIKNVKTFDTELDDWTTLPKADLIFSLCSFGMHVSIERYIDRLIATANDKCTMIFGTRNANGGPGGVGSGQGGNYGPDSFKDRFEEVIYQPGVIAYPVLPIEDWLILKNPIR
jgi:hypothetical protein